MNWLKKNIKKVRAGLWITMLLIVIYWKYNFIKHFYESILFLSLFLITSMLLLSYSFVRRNFIKFIALYLVFAVLVIDENIRGRAGYGFLDFILKFDKYDRCFWSNTFFVNLSTLFNLSNLFLIMVLKKLNYLNKKYFLIFSVLLVLWILIF